MSNPTITADDGQQFELIETTLFEGGPRFMLKPLSEPSEAEKPKRWRAEEGDSYWAVGGDGEVYVDTENVDILDSERYAYGNYFRTRKQAKAAAEAIKAMLAYIHATDQELADSEHWGGLNIAIESARQAVQQEAKR